MEERAQNINSTMAGTVTRIPIRLKIKVKSHMLWISTKESPKHELQAAWNELPWWYIRKPFELISHQINMVFSQKCHLKLY